MKIVKILSLLIVASIGIYALGPKVTFEPAILLYTKLNIPITELGAYISTNESKITDLKPDNQARIVWANDSIKNKTEYSIVYLHGFSSSQEEGDPIHIDFAKRYGYNLYLSRLEDHGRLDSNTFLNLTPDNYLQSAEDALAIGKILGDKVILMSCSTGGTLSAILASAGEDINSMIMYSPNIDIYDKSSDLLLGPWSKQLASIIMKGEHIHIQYDSVGEKYWNSSYHTNGIFAMKDMIHKYMNQEHFAKIKIPLFLGYYYKDQEHQDKVVSVKRMLEFYDQVGTPIHQKKKMAFPNAGHHVISSYVMSKDVENIKAETFKWAEEVLGLIPIN